jgi:hypothetical protein
MGTDLAYLKQLVIYWRDKYQWRVHEAALNAFDHYVTTIDGQLIHFVHQKSRHANATPLVMTHGWPGTFWEMLPSISALVDSNRAWGRGHRRLRCDRAVDSGLRVFGPRRQRAARRNGPPGSGWP